MPSQSKTLASPVHVSPSRVTPNGPNVTRTPTPRVIVNTPPPRRQRTNYTDAVPVDPRYQRFAPLLPPMFPDREAFKATNRWISRFEKVVGDRDDGAYLLAKNRKYVFGLAALTAGAGFILGAALVMATHQRSSGNKASGE